jgi:O-antigen ligase
VVIANSKHKTAEAAAPGMWLHGVLQAGVLFFTFFIAAIVPRLNVVSVFLLGLLSAWYLFVVVRKRFEFLTRLERPSAWAVTACLCVYLFLNASWSLVPASALNKALLVTGLAATILLAHRAFEIQSSQELQKAARIALYGAAIGFAITCFEFALGHPLQWWILKTWPGIRPEGNSIQILAERGGQVITLPSSQNRTPPPDEILKILTDGLNRHLSSLLLILWPAVCLALKAFQDQKRYIVAGILFALAAGAIFSGHSETAILALVGGTLTFVAAHYWPRAAHWTVTTAWCIAVIFAIPLVLAPYKAGLHKAEWLFVGARDRITIWNLTAERAMKTPVLGVGIRSTRAINRELPKTLEKKPDLVAPPRLGLHAHNNFLQVWFELGAVGAALVLALGLALLQTIRRMAADMRAFALAAFATACIVAAFGWGLWQSWLLSGYALSIISVRLADVAREHLSKT